jgi:hypothetical protein
MHHLGQMVSGNAISLRDILQLEQPVLDRGVNEHPKGVIAEEAEFHATEWTDLEERPDKTTFGYNRCPFRKFAASIEPKSRPQVCS